MVFYSVTIFFIFTMEYTHKSQDNDTGLELLHSKDTLIADKPFTEHHIYSLINDNEQQDCLLIRSFNTTIKSIQRGNKLEYYVWCSTNKFWRANHSLTNEIILIYQLIVLRAYKQNFIDELQRNRLMNKTRSDQWFYKINRYFSVMPDLNFKKQLDVINTFLPIKNGKKINMKTLEISDREKTDYWSSQFNHQFIDQQSFRDHRPIQFLRQLLPDCHGYDDTIKILESLKITVNKQTDNNGIPSTNCEM